MTSSVRQNYNNNLERNRTLLTSNPAQHILKEEHLEGINKQVKEVVKTQTKNFTPETDSKVADLLKVGAAVLLLVVVLFATLAAIWSSGAAIGFAATAGGVSLLLSLGIGYLGKYLGEEAEKRVKAETTVDKIHDDATYHRISRKVDEYDAEAELELARSYPAYNGQIAAAAAARRAAQQHRYLPRIMVEPIAPVAAIGAGLSAEEIAAI